MIAAKNSFGNEVEDVLARLTAAAYEVALRHGIRGSFLDGELGMWRELRAVLEETLTASESQRVEEADLPLPWAEAQERAF